MAPGDTRTGAVMESAVIPALEKGKYKIDRNVAIGTRFGVSKHKIDTLAEDTEGRVHLVSLKWQQVGGTAEQKIPFEIICLADALMQNAAYHTAYLVLGGEGWRFKDFYLNGGLNPHLTNAHKVKVVSMEGFISLANQGNL